MPSPTDLLRLLEIANETLSAEYKDWLDLSENPGRATLAKAAIALANHGGGVIIFGMRKDEEDGPLIPQPRPEAVARYNQDDINSAINRYADPEIHCELAFADHPSSGVENAFVSVPGGMTVPVMSKRECERVITARRCYIRKPGPRSEEPFTSEEWRTLLERCVRAGREDMLEAIRAIVQGRAGSEPAPTAIAELELFGEASRRRWQDVVTTLPADDPARFPQGRYELDFEILGVSPAPSLAELKRRMEAADQIKHTGWGPFVQLQRSSLAPHVVAGAIEAWLGAREEGQLTGRDPAHSNFWRADQSGKLVLLRGYDEDGTRSRVEPGTAFDITLPIWRVGEALLYVQRLAQLFGDDPAFIARCRYTGLRGRALVHLEGTRMLFGDRRSEDDAVLLERQITGPEARDNMSEVMRELLAPLYELFAFFELSGKLVSEELERMVRGRF